MQKIRQQHQHLNNNNGRIAKCNQGAPPPPPQAYNHLAANPAGITYGQLPHHMAHLASYAAPPQAPPAGVLSGKPPHYYLNNAKPSKYNNNSNNNVSSSGNNINNNNNNSYAPKAILQNTYRNAKGNGQATVVVGGATDAGGSGAGVSAEQALPTTLRIVGSCRNGNGESIVIASEEICEMPPTDSTDNSDTLPVSATPSEDCNSSSEHIDASGTLPNVDSRVSRGGKDKTPMCLVNELARYNKVSEEYLI